MLRHTLCAPERRLTFPCSDPIMDQLPLRSAAEASNQSKSNREGNYVARVPRQAISILTIYRKHRCPTPIKFVSQPDCDRDPFLRSVDPLLNEIVDGDILDGLILNALWCLHLRNLATRLGRTTSFFPACGTRR